MTDSDGLYSLLLRTSNDTAESAAVSVTSATTTTNLPENQIQDEAAAAAAEESSLSLLSSSVQLAHTTNNIPKYDWDTCTVYVGGIHSRMAQVHLEKLMKPYGTTKRLHLCIKNNGRNFAFCEYERVEDAMAAVHALHGRRLLGNTLAVRPAHQESKMGLLRHNGGSHNSNKPMDLKQEQRAIDSKIEALKRKLGR
jgi:RNA recognition motif-containing protein